MSDYALENLNWAEVTAAQSYVNGLRMGRFIGREERAEEVEQLQERIDSEEKRAERLNERISKLEDQMGIGQ